MVEVAAVRLRTSKPACLATLALYRDAPDASAPLWRIDAAPEAACTRRVTLGRVPAGFSASSPALPPLTGRYRVEVAGNGFTGTAHFTADTR